VLVAGPSFGVGSSREHAVWAIQQGGFDAVVAPSFSDIFRNNCTKNGLVPVVVPEDVVHQIWAAIDADHTVEITIDVERLTVEVPAAGITALVPRIPRHSTATSTASTTSASRSATPTTSPPEAARPAWLPDPPHNPALTSRLSGADQRL
jgi:3-isopropylmalate/(R)-2-methylmalate dehydratase small subunit